MYQHHCKALVIIIIMINNNIIIVSTNIALLQEYIQCCMVSSYFLDVQVLSKNQNGITLSALDQFTPNQNLFLSYIIVEDTKLQPIERMIVAIRSKLDLKQTSSPFISFFLFCFIYFFSYSILIAQASASTSSSFSSYPCVVQRE